ncbi:MAG: BlaI/MecI/CopY family transcriptional regulator [Candidatus Metalachnospira sp.]|nr:BlaI/MecI/CopY family transcriptional regulator [Candidatus Metalachnospira sp.]
MKEMPRISESEYEIMKLIWRDAPISTNDVVKRFEGINDWSPKTVQTLLARLVKKGALSYEKKGRVYIYTPLIKEKEYIHTESSSFLKKFYNGALNSMVLNFIDDDKLTDQDINELIRILEKGRKENR